MNSLLWVIWGFVFFLERVDHVFFIFFPRNKIIITHFLLNVS